MENLSYKLINACQSIIKNFEKTNIYNIYFLRKIILMGIFGWFEILSIIKKLKFVKNKKYE